jgi:hypothetical protein
MCRAEGISERERESIMTFGVSNPAVAPKQIVLTNASNGCGDGGFMPRLRILQIWIATATLSASLVLPTLAASVQTFTGKVSDTMCDAKHHEGIPPAECVRACVKHGAKYALVVGDKVYTLDTSNQAALDQLNKLAWEEAKVTGTANGDTISVKSVTAAK